MGNTIMWLILLVILVTVEIATMGLTTIWFAGGALVATIAAAFNAPFEVQLILFVSVSVLLLLFTRPIAIKYFNKSRVKTNAESLVGKKALVISEVNNELGSGQVTVEGHEWSARSSVEDKILELGLNTIVVGIQGIKLIVEERGK